MDLTVVYNDDILGLGDWAGTQVYYLITDDSGVQLQLLLSVDASVVQDSEGEVDPERLLVVTALYEQLLAQLTDPNISAGLATGDILAAGLLSELAGGASLLSGLVGFVQPIVAWLQGGGTGDPPPPVTLAAALDKTYPTVWSGDLQELVVELVLARADVPDDIADRAPQVRRVGSPVQPVEESGQEGDPSGLTTFANNFERAYFPYDDDQGVIKVGTGTNSDLSSQRFGRRSIWLQRWSDAAGTAVEILNDDAHPPVFYAPPPLSTQLITREVEGLREYQDSPSDFKEVNQVFTATDMDLMAADFLAQVETIFRPVMASAVADQSTPAVELYDPFVTQKESLAQSISEKVAYVFDETAGTGDPPSAQETWRQALLRTLENDYGFSTLTQLQALVSLHGEIEPGGDPSHPPQLYGAVQVPGEPASDSLPYSLTPTTLPLVEGQNWLNFLVSAQDPAAQRAFTLDLDYEVNQIEHLRDGAATACGYTPSSWITFVLQQNPEPLPQRQDNTLTQPIGETRIPIPLRSYPPLPKLQGVSASQEDPITNIPQALTWTATVTVERSSADQDSLNLSLSFNELQPTTAVAPLAARLANDRPVPSDLFAALARFVFEYPQLEPFIDDLPAGGGAESVLAVQEFSALIAGAALRWPEWIPPNPPFGGLADSDRDSDLEVWNFKIENVENSDNLQVTGTWKRDDGPPPFPQIEGYEKVSESGLTAIYQPDGGVPLATLVMSWPRLYVLDYQNIRPSAFTERNRNLAVPPQQTNPAFVYRTETVSWPTPIVPLITVGDLIDLPASDSLAQAVEAMLKQLTTPPDDSLTNDSSPLLRFETSIDYRYQVLAQNGSAFSLLPVFLLEEALEPGEEEAAAKEIASNLDAWRTNTGAQAKQSSLRFLLSVFATTIVTDDDRLPLVQFPGLVISVPDDDPGWW